MTANRSWVEVDLDAEMLTLTAPTPGYTSVLLTLCDATSCDDRVLDLHVVSLPDLEVTDLKVGDDSDGVFTELETAENGQFLKARVYVANYGFTNAEMVTIRCTVNGQAADIATIPTLAPGELTVAECSFQTPVNGDFMVVNAIVDGGEVIDERNESNNAMETSLTLSQPEIIESEDVSSGLSTTAVYVGSILVLILIIAGFRFLAPAKIRKYE
jgi:subtilase family serine protease